MNIKLHEIANICVVLFAAPLCGSGCQMISQNTSSEYNKVAIPYEGPVERPVLLVKSTGKTESDDSFGNLSTIALKSMQIAEDKAQQNEVSALRRQTELQNLIEKYFGK